MSASPSYAIGLADTAASEAEFYDRYAWCLNPFLTIQQLFTHLAEELARLDVAQSGWQREEHFLNSYLFTSGVACTVADFLTASLHSLKAVGRRFPRLAGASSALEGVARTVQASSKDFMARHLAGWLSEWRSCVDLACRMLIFPEQRDTASLKQLAQKTSSLAGSSMLPQALLKKRMQVISGFRSQDLTHHDVLSLAERFATSCKAPLENLTVIGLRTAGSYFAPLVKVHLDSAGWRNVSWMSIRPKRGPSSWERARLATIARRGWSVVITDDHPDTGETLVLALDILRKFGIQMQNVTIVVPKHPAQRDPDALRGRNHEVQLVTLDTQENYKVRKLEENSIRPLLLEYAAERGWRSSQVCELEETSRINARFDGALLNSFQTRLKRVYDLQSLDAPEHQYRRVIAKSVGWGWLGYHAFIAGRRLEGFVPRVLGLRYGLLFSEWIQPQDQPQAPPPEILAAYIARRTDLLRLDSEPRVESRQSETGWERLALMLRGFYGPHVGLLKYRTLKRHLEEYRPCFPVFLDGSMRPERWVTRESLWLKTDFEHHGFGNPCLAVVDPAYDLAAAALDCDLDRSQQERLLRSYIANTGDESVSERLILYQLLCGVVLREAALYRLERATRSDQKEVWNSSYLRARSYLAYCMSRFCARRLQACPALQWSERALFMDLDGVFDREMLGFPATSEAGLKAIHLLRQAFCAVVLNSGRSMEHVRNYCELYGFAGGIAEHGSVFLDAISHDEVVLTSASAQEQIEACRADIRSRPGVFLDDGYRFLLRAYRFRGRWTAALGRDELQTLLPKYPALRAFNTDSDTYILDAGVDKGSAATAVMKRQNLNPQNVAAIGDSDADIAMLRVAGRAYAPSTCGDAVKKFARSGKCKIMDQPVQRGLLAAVREFLGEAGGFKLSSASPLPESSHLLNRLLHAADRTMVTRAAAILHWGGI